MDARLKVGDVVEAGQLLLFTNGVYSDYGMKIILLTHAERRALIASIAPEHRFIDTSEGNKGDIIILNANREPILRIRLGD